MQASLEELAAEQIEIPLIIGGEEIRTGNTATSVCPHRHAQVLATYHKGDRSSVDKAAQATARVAGEWAETPWEDRAAASVRA